MSALRAKVRRVSPRHWVAVCGACGQIRTRLAWQGAMDAAREHQQRHGGAR